MIIIENAVVPGLIGLMMTIIIQAILWILDASMHLNANLILLMPILSYGIYYFVHKRPLKTVVAKVSFNFLTTLFSHMVNGFVGRIGFLTTTINQLVEQFPKWKIYRPVFLSTALSVCLRSPIASAFMVCEFSHIRDSRLIMKMVISNLTSYFLLMFLNIPTNHSSHIIPLDMHSMLKVVLLSLVLVIVYCVIKLVFKLGQSIDEHPVYLVGSAMVLMFVQYHFRYIDLINVQSFNNINPLVLLLLFLLTQTSKLKGGIIAPLIILGASFGHCFGEGFTALGAIGLLCLVANYRYSTMILGMELFGYGNIIFYVLFTIIANIMKKGVKKGETVIKNVCQRLSESSRC